MSEVGHDLHAMFPGEATHLHALKLESGPFRALAERHNLLSREIARIESGLDAASDERLEELKRERVNLLDEVAAMIAERKGKK